MDDIHALYLAYFTNTIAYAINLRFIGRTFVEPKGPIYSLSLCMAQSRPFDSLKQHDNPCRGSASSPMITWLLEDPRCLESRISLDGDLIFVWTIIHGPGGVIIYICMLILFTNWPDSEVTLQKVN